MSLPYRALALRSNPLSPTFALPHHPNAKGSLFTMHAPHEILSDEILEEFAAASLVPATVALFYKTPGSAGLVHIDVMWMGDRWVKWTCAVNWDLFGAESAMRWYECRARECWPTDEEGREKNQDFLLNGVHFNRRHGAEIDPGDLRQVAGVRLTGPTLVRTSLAHSVAVSDTSQPRWCLSVRFTQDFQSWDEAVGAFEPLFDRAPATPHVAAAVARPRKATTTRVTAREMAKKTRAPAKKTRATAKKTRAAPPPATKGRSPKARRA